MLRRPAPHVVCFGEILWDFLPDALHAGGAPFNVAYHLHRQGAEVHVASAVGRDPLGAELLRRLDAWGIATGGIARDRKRPTGYVRAELGAGGDARYEIIRGVAWDCIPATPVSLAAARHSDAFIFGSLAQRSSANRGALRHLLAALRPETLRVFDVNLRPPFDDLKRVRRLAREATLLKLNADEAARLAGATKSFAGGEEAHARALAAELGCPIVVVTAGARGAGFLRHGRWHWEKAKAVKVVDTVGAGDAFLATLVAQLLAGHAGADALARACRTGEWVATCRGATPAYPLR